MYEKRTKSRESIRKIDAKKNRRNSERIKEILGGDRIQSEYLRLEGF